MAGVFAMISPFSVFAAPRLCASVAGVLAEGGSRVLLFELCPTVPALAEALGVADKVLYTLSDVGRILPEDVFLRKAPTPAKKRGKTGGEILLVPLFAGEALTEDAARAMHACIAAACADIVLICAESGQAPLARAVADTVLLLTPGDGLCLRTAAAHRAVFGADGFILTRYTPTRAAVKAGMSLVGMADALGLPLVGILPDGAYGRAVKNLAGRLSGDPVSLLDGIGIEGMSRKAYLKSALR